MISEELLNPFGSDPQMELPHPIQNVPLWTEFFYLFGMDSSSGHACAIHVGREPFDPAIWRATIHVYLPNKKLLTAKYSGRDGHSRGPGAGPLRVCCVEPWRLWTAEFDGVCQSIESAQTMNAAQLDATNEPVKFFFIFDAAAPVWDLGRQIAGQAYYVNHWEQICRVHGTLSYRGVNIKLAGGGVRDHSSGPRDYAPVIGGYWANALFDDGSALMAQRLRSEKSDLQMGYLFRNDGTPLQIPESVECPDVSYANTPDGSIIRDLMLDKTRRETKIILRCPEGAETVEVKLVHAAAATYVPPSQVVLGTDFSRLDRAVHSAQVVWSPAEFWWGKRRGIGVVDLITRISTLQRPTAAVAESERLQNQRSGKVK